MTLISIATYGDHAEFITDTASYTRMLEHIGHTTKHATINHLDAVVLTQGDSAFGGQAKAVAAQVAAQVDTFDQLVDLAPEWIRETYSLSLLTDDTITDETTFEDLDAIVFLVGWSDREHTFAAYLFASVNDFDAVQILTPFTIPTSYLFRPSAVELEALRDGWTDTPKTAAAVEKWATLAEMPAPLSLVEWLGVATTSREHRSLGGNWAKVIVAGDVLHTRLERGAVTTNRIHTFDDTGDELAQMVEHTQHPVALASPCWCGGETPYGDCHGRRCHCDSGKLWGLCHGAAQSAADSLRVSAGN